ncbi:MAG: septum formation protein Maf [Acidobacteria bacterium]|nr:septum formation protein Maf [Acidobacteriota bacterium]
MTTSRKVRWILASASPRRREMLAGLGLRFAVDPCVLPEPAIRGGERPRAYAVRAARMKARHVAARHRSGLVVGADTVVVCGDAIFGKPSTRKEARHMLQRLSGRWHRVITGVSVCDSASLRTASGHSESRVHFRRMSPAEIDWYLDTGEYSDKAGAYGIQGCAALFIDRIEGCYFNVVGFPVATFERLCRRLGYSLITHLPVGRPRRPRASAAANPT